MASEVSRAIRRYVRETGWTKFRFAQVCGIHHTAVSHLLVGRRYPSLHTALLIVQGTAHAFSEGWTTVAPLALRDIAPKFAAMADAVKMGATGTNG